MDNYGNAIVSIRKKYFKGIEKGTDPKAALTGREDRGRERHLERRGSKR